MNLIIVSVFLFTVSSAMGFDGARKKAAPVKEKIAPAKENPKMAAQEIFISAFRAVREGEKDEALKKTASAKERFEHAARLLLTLQEFWPKWEPEMVSFRLSRTLESIARLE
jgi:hypothetical protein